jgi:glucosylceramidase
MGCQHSKRTHGNAAVGIMHLFAEDEGNFLKKSLGPTLEKEGLGAKKIIIWDHNRDLIFQRVSTTLSDPEVAKYVWGIGYHWYETWTGGDMQFENLKRVAETFPDKNLIFHRRMS